MDSIEDPFDSGHTLTMLVMLVRFQTKRIPTTHGDPSNNNELVGPLIIYHTM
jgi:hypothetical protein